MSSLLEITKVRGHSVATRLVSCSPIKLIPTAAFHSECRIYTSSYGGGVLQGDRLELEVHCHENATLLLQAQGNQHLYTCNDDQRIAHQGIVGRLEPGATALILPEPTVMHSGAHFHQTQTWDMSTNSELLLLDAMHAGRSENNECFHYHSFRSDISFKVMGREVYRDYFLSEPNRERHNLASRFGDYALMFNIYSFGKKSKLLHQALAKDSDSIEAHQISELPYSQSKRRPAFFCATHHDEESGITTTRVLARQRQHLKHIEKKLWEMSLKLLSST